MNKKENKFWKKTSIIVSLIVFIISCFIYVSYLNSNKKDASDYYITDIYERHKNDVDSGIAEFMSSKEFKAMDEERQVDGMKKLLDIYVSCGEIKNLYYDESTKMYTFQYKDGILGGVMLKDFDSNMN